MHKQLALCLHQAVVVPVSTPACIVAYARIRTRICIRTDIRPL